MTIKVNPEFKSLIPPLSEEEFDQLESNILKDGEIRDAIVTWNDMIIDGHNRYEISLKHNLPFKTFPTEFQTEEEVKSWMINNQFGRRNLTAFVRSELALELKKIVAKQAKDNQGTRTDIPQKSVKGLEKIDTQKVLAKKAEVSHDTISKVEQILKVADDETKNLLRQGEISINAAHKGLIKKEDGSFHTSKKNNDWYTPSDYLEAARVVLDAIDLDPASSDIAQKQVKATTYYTKEINGLDKEWSGRIWLNPPYSMPEVQQFIDKLISSEKVTQWIVLTNNSSDTNWFHSLIENSDLMCFTKGRIGFIDVDGTQKLQARQGQTFFYKGSNQGQFIKQFSKFGALVRVAHDFAA